MKTPIFRRRKVKKIKGKKSKQETRYSFIHFLTWDPELNMPIQAPDNKKMSSRKEIEDIVSNCLDKKRNEIPDFINHLHKKRGWYCVLCHV